MNEADSLKKELCKRIFNNLGLIPNNFGIVGISLPEFYSKKPVQTEVDGEIITNETFVATISFGNKYVIGVTNLGTHDEPELTMIMEQVDSGMFGFKLEYIDDDVRCLMGQLRDGIWTELSLTHQLNMTIFFETITAEGKLWEPEPGASGAMHKLLTGALEHDMFG